MRLRDTLAAWRIALFILLLSSMLWLGGSAIRALIGFDILKTGTLMFDDTIAPEAQREVFRLISLISLFVAGAYVASIVSSAVFLVTTPLKVREHGWLMMSAILLYGFIPAEVYVLVYDVRMIYLEFFTTAGNEAFRQLFVDRFAALGGVPVIASLCYGTIIALAVFQPLTRPDLRHEN